MPNDITIALIGAAASVACAFIARQTESSKAARQGKSRHPAMAFFTALAVGLSITALFFAYSATKTGAPADIAPGKVFQNSSRRPYFLTLFCNATRQSKDMTAEIGNVPQSLKLIASESGGDRMSASVVVPPGFYYRVDATQVPGLGCSFKQWPL